MDSQSVLMATLAPCLGIPADEFHGSAGQFGEPSGQTSQLPPGL